MTIPSSRSLIFEVKSTGSKVAFICVLTGWYFRRFRKTSEFFGRLQTSLGIFGNDCVVFKNPSTPRIKNREPRPQEKLAGILEFYLTMESAWPKRNKSHYVTEIIPGLGFTDIIFSGDKRLSQKYICIRRLSRMWFCTNFKSSVFSSKTFKSI